MAEIPVKTVGEVVEIVSPRLSQIRLKNGKTVLGFLGKGVAAEGWTPEPRQMVGLEMTPFDFSKARIVGLAKTASQSD